MPAFSWPGAFVGLLFSCPYYWLSGGVNAYSIPCIILVPIATGLGVQLYSSESARRRSWTPSPAFGMYLLWVLAPIFMTSLSHFLRFQGYENAARIAFEQRFLPIWLPIVILLVIALMLNDLLDTSERMKKFHERYGREAIDPPKQKD